MSKAIGRFILLSALVAGCAGVPKSHAKRNELKMDAAQAKEEMLSKDPSLQSLIDQSAGYIVFPAISQGGFVVGGASGKGVVYENGQPAGYANLSQASVGAQVGGQKFAEMIVVREQFTLDKIKSGSLDVGGQASAVILKAGAGSAAHFGANGVAVVVNPIGGAMVNVSVTGQRIKATM